MNQELSAEALALSRQYLDSYSSLAYDIASQYVASPDLLRVDARIDRAVIFVCFPGTHRKADYGKLIGGIGRNFRALKRILQEYGSRFKHRVELEVLDPVGPKESESGPPFVEDTTWDQAKDEAFRERLESIVERVFGWPVPVRAHSSYNITHFVIETEAVAPDLVAAFAVLWLAIGNTHGRKFKLNAEAPRAVANG